MLWQKTSLGLVEVKARSLDIDVVARNLLMLIDGKKTEAMFLAHTAGVRGEHFRSLFSMKLIEPVDGTATASPAGETTRHVAAGVPAAPISSLALNLSRVISKQLGFGGMRMSQLAARARTAEEVRGVSAAFVDLVRQRHGLAAAEKVEWQITGRDTGA